VTLVVELDLDSVKMNQDGNYLCQKSFRSKVIVRTDRQTHETGISSIRTTNKYVCCPVGKSE